MNRIPIPENNGYAGEPETPPESAPFLPVSWADLDRERPQRGPAVIGGVVNGEERGILREGGVGTLVSASKARKTWVVMALAIASACGREWLGYPVAKGRVLLLDAELTRATLYWRLKKVAEGMGVDPAALQGMVEVFCLRGQTRRAAEALKYAADKGPGYYRLIVIDPLSCFYPADPQFSENSNSDLRRVCDSAITFAERTRAALMIVHHATKGAQGEKDIIDVGAGAGAVARSVDAHLILRRHRERDVLVLDGVLRDFPELTPTCWRWNFPIYSPSPELNPADLAGARPKKEKSTKVAKTEPMSLDRFVKAYLTDEGRELVHVQALATETMTARAAETSLRQAVALKKAYLWPGSGGANGRPKRYAIIPCPITEITPSKSSLSLHTQPPTPPVGAKSTTGRGKCAEKERTKTPPVNDASMRTSNKGAEE